MKSERHIREHRDNLRMAMKLPCGCAGTAHETQCLIGLKMMLATVETLSWILDENGDMDRLAEEYSAVAKRGQP